MKSDLAYSNKFYNCILASDNMCTLNVIALILSIYLHQVSSTKLNTNLQDCTNNFLFNIKMNELCSFI